MSYALIFPGQGSQKVGMGLDLYQNFDSAKRIFNQADEIIGEKLSDIIFYGPEEELNQTKFTQPAIVAVSVALITIFQEKLESKGIFLKPTACCGHSLGEFTALWYSKVLDLESLMKIVTMRGRLMQTAPYGAMVAIINTEIEKINELLNKEEFKNKIVIANYNTPNQIVLSGEKSTINSIPEKIKTLGGKAIILPVSGAFHSPLMKEPAEQFALYMNDFFKSSTNIISIPIYQNYDGKSSILYNEIKEKVTKQMTSSVLWTQTINNFVANGIETVIEIGPGKILTGLIKKINENIKCFNITDIPSLEELAVKYEHKLL